MTRTSSYWIVHEDEVRGRPGRLLLRALRALLETRGVVEARSGNDAPIWIYCDVSPDIQMSARDVAVLPFPINVRAVLLLRFANYQTESSWEDGPVRVFVASEGGIAAGLRKVLTAS